MMGNKKKLIASISYLVVLAIVASISLMTFLDKSTAWFAENKRVSGDGMQIKIKGNDSIYIDSITIYKVDENNNSASQYTDPDANALQDLLTLNKYDYVFEEKRGHIPIIVKATLVNFQGDIETASEVEINVTLNENETSYTEEDENDKKYLIPNISNFISISCSSDSRFSDEEYLEGETVNAVTYYPHARDLFLNNKEEFVPQTFVDYDVTLDPVDPKNNVVTIGEKAETLTFTVTRPAGQQTLDVYLLLNYDEHLIAKYVADNDRQVEDVGELEGFFAWGAQITFHKDIDSIVFSEKSTGAE